MHGSLRTLRARNPGAGCSACRTPVPVVNRQFRRGWRCHCRARSSRVLRGTAPNCSACRTHLARERLSCDCRARRGHANPHGGSRFRFRMRLCLLTKRSSLCGKKPDVRHAEQSGVVPAWRPALRSVTGVIRAQIIHNPCLCSACRTRRLQLHFASLVRPPAASALDGRPVAQRSAHA